MDDGYVIPGLNEDYTLGGAKVMEWVAGVMAGLLIQEFGFDGGTRGMPLVIATVLLTTFSLASLRRRYPDEERGLRNQVMVSVGVTPPGIPPPAELQPYWSGAPIRKLSDKSYFEELGIAEMLKHRLDGEEGGSD